MSAAVCDIQTERAVRRKRVRVYVLDPFSLELLLVVDLSLFILIN